jgi:hypothetical protein
MVYKRMPLLAFNQLSATCPYFSVEPKIEEFKELLKLGQLQAEN